MILSLFKQTIIITFRLSSFSPGAEALRETGRDWKGVCVKNSTLSPRSVAAVTADRNNTDLLMFTSPSTNVLPSTREGKTKSLVPDPGANRLKTTPKISAITICVKRLLLPIIHLNVTYLHSTATIWQHASSSPANLTFHCLLLERRIWLAVIKESSRLIGQTIVSNQIQIKILCLNFEK